MPTEWQEIETPGLLPDGYFLERFANLDYVPSTFRVFKDEWVDDGASEPLRRTIIDCEVIDPTPAAPR